MILRRSECNSLRYLPLVTIYIAINSHFAFVTVKAIQYHKKDNYDLNEYVYNDPATNGYVTSN